MRWTDAEKLLSELAGKPELTQEERDACCRLLEKGRKMARAWEDAGLAMNTLQFPNGLPEKFTEFEVTTIVERAIDAWSGR